MTTDSPAVPRQDVWFRSRRERCHAWLYMPTPTETPPPVIVMAHGLGAVKTLRLDAFAERFAANGYAALVFDYRHFGDSEGEPRELISIRSQRQDWKAAIAYARTLSDVDRSRIILWGTSFAGGHVIATAADMPDVTAAVVQCPFTDGVASARVNSPAEIARLFIAAVRDLASVALRRPPVRIKGAARPGETGLMSRPEDVERILALLRESGLNEAAYRNDVPARVALTIPLARPGRRTSDVRCPILFCVSEQDGVAPASATLQHAQRAPRGEIRTYSTGHFDIYTGDMFEQVVRDQLDFLRRHVPID